jgi:hypothetical protein
MNSCVFICAFIVYHCLQGAIFVVLGVTLAAINAYSLSKGVGRKLAQKVIASEMKGEEEGGAVAKQLSAVTAAIEAGGFMRQVTAITLLRLTPVVPFRWVGVGVPRTDEPCVANACGCRHRECIQPIPSTIQSCVHACPCPWR